MRASWVEEIKVNVAPEAGIPIDQTTLEDAYDSTRGPTIEPHASELLTKLDMAGSLPRLRHVCLFTAQLDPHPVSDAPPTSYGINRHTPGDDQWENIRRQRWIWAEDERYDEWVEDLPMRDFDVPDSGHSRMDDEDRWEAWKFEDDSDYRTYQEGCEKDLAQARQDVVRRLLGLVSAGDDAFDTIRTPTDEAAMALLRLIGPLTGCRIVVSAKPSDDLSPAMADLNPNVDYDFAGVSAGLREFLQELLVEIYDPEVLCCWRWVNDDGTTSPLVK